MQRIIFYAIFICLQMQYSLTEPDDTLLLVNMLYRHGDRSPEYTFPTNPVPVSVWPQGLGQLTQIGMRQQHSQGAYMRERYKGFINPSYSVFEIKVRSTDFDRTLMSAESHLSGLYPPSGYQLWNPSIHWQPIPVLTVPYEMDSLLQMRATCPKANKLLKEQLASKTVKDFIKKHQATLDYLSNKTGMNVELTNMFKVYDTLYVQKRYNFSYPSWYNSSIREATKLINDFEFFQRFSTDELLRLRSGPLIKEMLKNMKDKTANPTSQSKIFMYSGHDTTMISFLLGIRAFTTVSMPYASTILVELHKNTSGINFFVRVLFHHNTKEPTVLTMQGCEKDCPLEKFESLMKLRMVDNWQKECGLQDDKRSSMEYITYAVVFTIAGIGIGIILAGIGFFNTYQK